MIDEVLDRCAVESVLARYCSMVDCCDSEGASALFTDDCEFDWGWQRIVRGRDGVRELLGALSRWSATSHHSSVLRVVFPSSGRAEASSSILAWHRVRETSAVERILGRYEDELELTDAGWLIRRRSLRAAGAPGFPVSTGMPGPFEPLPRRV